MVIVVTLLQNSTILKELLCPHQCNLQKHFGRICMQQAGAIKIFYWENLTMLSFSVRTQSHTQFLDITSHVQSTLSKMNFDHGIAAIFIPHTTAGITINENADPDVVSDMANALEKALPWDAGYRHSEGNAAAHVKASMMGSSVIVIVEKGLLQLGTCQAIYLCEFDGPRTRSIWVEAR
jgi:secondary thiamine-phosphate synthase enzyme